MKNDEILIVQDYLKITFGNEDIQIRKPENDDDLNSIFIQYCENNPFHWIHIYFEHQLIR